MLRLPLKTNESAFLNKGCCKKPSDIISLTIFLVNNSFLNEPHKTILPIIVVAQFCCTSSWFASNAVMSDLVINFGLTESAIGHLTSAVQFGFI
jgi:hypothetical protein